MSIKTPWANIHKELGYGDPAFENRTLASYVEDHARTRGDMIALRFGPMTYSFARVNAEANKLASALAARGIGHGDTVGVHMPNIPQYPIAIIAISKLGAIGSGVSPLLAPPELVHQITDAKIKVLLSLSDLAPAVTNMPSVPEVLGLLVSVGARDLLDAPHIEATPLKGVESISYLDLVADAADEFSSVEVDLSDTFMIQYTGGTTGPPKGAELSHRNIMHNPVMMAGADPEHISGEEVYATAFPYFHIAGLCFGLSGLMYGAQQYLLPNPRDIDAFIELMLAEPPTRLGCVPALYDMLVAHPRVGEVDFSRLKLAKTGAAPMTSTTYDRLAKVIGENKISDVFGMTETSPCYLTNPLARYKPGSVGIPLPSAIVRIMDVETGTREMPTGEPGEITTTGPQIMKGYLGLPEESAHAVRELDGHRWMYSGDVGYMDEEGYIFLCDRAKDMLIVGGFKVFSVEVEDKLATMDEIAESAVIGTPDRARPGNDIVHLFVQRSAGAQAEDEDVVRTRILTFIRKNMAPYKVPKHIHFLDAIPLTPVGKIDKKAMRILAQDTLDRA